MCALLHAHIAADIFPRPLTIKLLG